MKDIVSMRKMRPLPDSGTSCGFGLAAGAGSAGSAEVFNEDCFFGGNWPSLAVQCGSEKPVTAIPAKYYKPAYDEGFSAIDR
jgi:hypothetical protein